MYRGFVHAVMNRESQLFLHDAADRLRELVELAPDISEELRRFAYDLERLAAEDFTDRSGPGAA